MNKIVPFVHRGLISFALQFLMSHILRSDYYYDYTDDVRDKPSNKYKTNPKNVYHSV
jgi:hypothetical protein